jgi:hypothetical protein
MFNRKDSKWNDDAKDYLYLAFKSFGGCSFTFGFQPYEEVKLVKTEALINYEEIEK